MREAVIDRDGVLHYATFNNWSNAHVVWFIYCDTPSRGSRISYFDKDVVRGNPTCVRCLGREALRGKDLEPIDVPCR